MPRTRLIYVTALGLLLAAGACHRRKASSGTNDGKTGEASAPRVAESFTPAEQAVPTIKGVGITADNPFAKALAGNDAQAQLRVLNDLLMVWEQTNTEQPFTALEDLVSAGLLSKLPNPPPGMEFAFSPKRHSIELVPRGARIRGVGASTDDPTARALAGKDVQGHLKTLNEMLMIWEQSRAGQPFTGPEDLVKAGLLSELPTPPPGMKFIFNPKRHAVELVAR